MKQLLTTLLLFLCITASAQSKLKISTLDGEEFSCLLSDVAIIRVHDYFVNIVSRKGEYLFTFSLSDKERQTIVFCDEAEVEIPEAPDKPQKPEGPGNPETSIDYVPNISQQAIVYPNPTNDILQIRNAGDNPLVRLISMSGAVLLETQDTEVDLRNLANGTYIITVNNQAFKIIKE